MFCEFEPSYGSAAAAPFMAIQGIHSGRRVKPVVLSRSDGRTAVLLDGQLRVGGFEPYLGVNRPPVPALPRRTTWIG